MWIPATLAAALVCAGVWILGQTDSPAAEAPTEAPSVAVTVPETQTPAQIPESVPASIPETTQKLTPEEIQYNEAVTLFKESRYGAAAIAFAKLGDYADARQLSHQIWDAIAERKTVSSGSTHVVAVKTDGTAVARGTNHDGECDVKNWSDIIAVATGSGHTVGLKSDGTVVATGRNAQNQCEVGDWQDIVAIYAGHGITFGIKSDGTVVSTAKAGGVLAQSVANLQNVVKLSYFPKIHSDDEGVVIGIKSDGSVFGPEEITGWQNIISLTANYSCIFGVQSDGNIITYPAKGESSDVPDFSKWQDIRAIDTFTFWGWYAGGKDAHVLGLKSDGTVVAVGKNNYKQCRVSGWQDIVAVSTGYYNSFGLKTDGTVTAIGRDYTSAPDIWKNVRLPADRDALLAGIAIK